MFFSLADAKMLANMILVFAATALIFCARLGVDMRDQMHVLGIKPRSSANSSKYS